ncbi:MAG: hypothetical protein J5607_07345 [Clostridiales bacterium]|nr:hypothetical protein [Clostridiales bacterium]
MIGIRRAVKEDFEILEELYRELEEDGVFYQPQHFVLSPKGARSEYMAGSWRVITKRFSLLRMMVR